MTRRHQTVWETPRDISLLSTVFVDDFINGLAGPQMQPNKRRYLLWITRGFLHGIHATFPPPDVLQHKGGKDSISMKKLELGDARWKPSEALLGVLTNGGFGEHRVVALPESKYNKYRGSVTAALDAPRGVIGFNQFRKIHGQVQYVSVTLPCLRGLMTPLNRRLALVDLPVALGQHSTLRRTLRRMVELMDVAQLRPSHICEIVPPDLPHYYGTLDAAAVGAGGVWLPCTRYLHPTVWRVKWPADIEQAVRDGTLTMADCESAAYFIQECLLDHLLDGQVAGVSSFNWSDNTPTVGRITRRTSGGESHMAEDMLYTLAMRQIYTRRGPSDCNHWPGIENLMGDVPSRSYEAGFPEGSDTAFLESFSNQFPLPENFPRITPTQQSSWRIVTPPNGIVFAAISLLRGTPDTSMDPTATIGGFGCAMPRLAIKTLSSTNSEATITSWNEANCSWPLLEPSGKVSSTVADHLRDRASRRRYEKSPNSWSLRELEILGEQLSDKGT